MNDDGEAGNDHQSGDRELHKRPTGVKAEEELKGAQDLSDQSGGVDSHDVANGDGLSLMAFRSRLMR